MVTLGVTGGIGSGKSTVCRILKSMGAQIFYADNEARRLLIEDPEVRNAVVSAFGPESYTDDGDVNREFLAERIFSSDTQVRRMNTIVHPKVHQAFEQARLKAAKSGVPMLVEEAALIFESGADRDLDVVVVVDAPAPVRLKRVQMRDDAEEEAVRRRMGHQWSQEELLRRADFVIENDGSLDDLRRQTEGLYRHLVTQSHPL